MGVDDWKKAQPLYFDTDAWQFYKFCNCGGTPKFKYKNHAKGFELWIMPKSDIFKLWKFNGRPGEGGLLRDLKAKLAEL